MPIVKVVLESQLFRFKNKMGLIAVLYEKYVLERTIVWISNEWIWISYEVL